MCMKIIRVLTHSSEFLMCCLALAISAANELGDEPWTKRKTGIKNHITVVKKCHTMEHFQIFVSFQIKQKLEQYSILL